MNLEGRGGREVAIEGQEGKNSAKKGVVSLTGGGRGGISYRVWPEPAAQ